MRKWLIGTLSAIALSLGAGLFAIVYAAIGRSRGEEWGDLDAPGFQVASIGYGAFNLLALSIAVLIVLIVVAAVRERRSRRSR